jgi:hypothetical protein
VQVAQVRLSLLHSKVEPVSVEVKLKLADVLVVGLFGCEVIVVSGAVVSEEEGFSIHTG